MQSPKEEVAALIDRLPDDATIEDVQYQLYFIEKVRSGLTAADAGQKLSQDEAELRLNKWLLQ
jgi:hypothetical protein